MAETTNNSGTLKNKLKIFISSICGNDKYDKIRLELANAIEATEFANVYLFEGEGASTLTAGNHYTFALEDSDVCIFLIDNKDGVPTGVQKEADTVKKHGIKALYYFCDESSKVKTALEESLMGVKFAKSTTVHSFSDLSKNGASELIKDIITIYHYYCKGKLVINSEHDSTEITHDISVAGIENSPSTVMPKTILKNIDKCKDYILKASTGYPYFIFPDKSEKTSPIDEWGHSFLKVLFEGKSIKEFNMNMFLDCLKSLQSEEYHDVVKSRWTAVQAYFSGDVNKCIQNLNIALEIAKSKKCAIWIIQDILIDIRNLYSIKGNIENTIFDSEAQNELTNMKEEFYYPIMDRISYNLDDKYLEGLFKEKIKSPYTVTLGNNFNVYGDLLASLYIVSIYNGSLTHILILYERMQELLFYLNNKYDDWKLRCNLFKIAVFRGNEKEIKGIKDSYPEILNNLNAKDAQEIMEFCKNEPIAYKRFKCELLAFGSVGYYLEQTVFDKYKKTVINEIGLWLKNDKPPINLGFAIIKCMEGISVRITQDSIADICNLLFNKHYGNWYIDLFKFFSREVDISKMSNEKAKLFISNICKIIEDENEREMLKYSPYFLCVFRKQSLELTEVLDEKVKTFFPVFYNGDYSLELADREQNDFSEFLIKYIEKIDSNNKTQGINGAYHGHSNRDLYTVKTILMESKKELNEEIMDDIIKVATETLLYSKETVSIKSDAINLLICIIFNFKNDYKRNTELFNELYEKRDEIQCNDNYFASSNINKIALLIELQFLFTAMGKEAYSSLLELMPYINNDVPTTLSVVKTICDYLYNKDNIRFPKFIESYVLQYSLQWINSDNLDIRWLVTRILLALLRNPDNHLLINRQLLTIIDNQNFYIKNLILRNVFDNTGVFTSTRDYIVSKCLNDPNYVVRLVCDEEIAKHNKI